MTETPRENRLRSGRLSATLRAEKLGMQYLGFRIFKWLLGFTVLVLALIVWFAWGTYPSQPDYVPSPSTATDAQWGAYDAAKAAWMTQLKDVGQLFLLTPVFPLMGAVLGYIFAQQTVPKSNPDPPK